MAPWILGERLWPTGSPMTHRGFMLWRSSWGVGAPRSSFRWSGRRALTARAMVTPATVSMMRAAA